MKFFAEIIKDGFLTLKLNKMRTGLAILGIVIGIGSVIALMSIGEASKKSVQNQIQSLGANLLTISPGSQSQGMVRGAAGGRTTLTSEDASALEAKKYSAIKTVSPEYSSRTQVISSQSNTNTQVYGVTQNYQTVHKVTLSSGQFISENDLTANSKVAVLGPTVVEDLFGDSSFNPIGQSIKINGQSFQVIGVTKAKGGSGMSNQDDQIYIPLSVAQKQVFGVKYLSAISLEAISQEEMTRAMNQAGYFLLERHKITDTTKADFTIRSQADIMSAMTSVSGTLTGLLSGVAAISLIVGGIGIMNIMLVTVTERTREIGLRKALGAKKKAIIYQFLVESVILTFSGGMIGILAGILTAFVYAQLNSSLFAISVSSIFLAFFVSVAIGIVFGWYPAKRASALQPIEALRYE
ncbi:MAG TPA: ABC transporter permease [Candidatus Woesebacteria bacterium]|nr:ABC transporter permease [Candidatus Woesebacteria bacterium]